MKLRRIGLVIVLAASLSGAVKASPLDFDFTTYDDTDAGSITITGEIIGLTDNATSAPTDIIINSDTFNANITAPGYSLVSNGFIPSPYVADTFTVSGGQVTGGSLSWYATQPPPNSDGQPLSYNFNAFGFNGEDNVATGLEHGNDNGFDTVNGTTFTPAVTSVPEPSQWGLGVFLAFVGCAAFRRFSLQSRKM